MGGKRTEADVCVERQLTGGITVANFNLLAEDFSLILSFTPTPQLPHHDWLVTINNQVHTELLCMHVCVSSVAIHERANQSIVNPVSWSCKFLLKGSPTIFGKQNISPLAN